MAHQHSVYDTDKHFKIDPITREIINQTPEKIQLIQGDHNSERFTFEIARVEGHAMSQCNKIEVHFLNVAADKTGQSADVYLVEDMQISPDSNDVIIFSWLISGNATKFAGTLNFIVRFSCLTGETIDYVWNTGIFKGIGVGEGMSNSEGVIAEFSDVLEAWRQDLFEAGGDSVANVNMAREAALTAIQEEKATQVVAIEEKGAEVLAAIPEEYGALNANVEANAADIADLQKAGEKHSSLISRDDKRITTLEAAVYGDLAQMVVDNTAAHIKDVPTDARGTARIGMVGGMTYKDGDTLKSAPVTELGSVGVNIWDEQWKVITWTTNPSIGSANHIPVLPNTKYYMTHSPSNGLFFYDANGVQLSKIYNSVFTTPENCYFISFVLASTYGTEYLNDICINKYDTAINGKYYPYIRNTLPIPEAVQALDGYGEGVSESVYNYIDYEKKQFVKRVGCVDMGTLTWAISNGILYNSTMFSNIAKTNSGEIANILCAEYQTITTIEMDTKTIDKSISYYVYTSGKGGTLKVYDSDYTDPETFKAAMSGVMLYYELATPEVTDISDILSVDNYIEVEGGGSLTFKNEYKYDVPSEVTFVTKGVSE